MDKILSVAKFICDRYEEITKESLVNDEMKLHKLLYFTQRESFAVLGRPAFEGDFEGWKFGPVSREVRMNYGNGEILADTEEVSYEIQYIASNVIIEYGSLATWKLSELSHKESSWINAREGLKPYENGDTILLLSDIAEDAKKVRPYDHVWDMYYDEFDDADETVVLS